MCTEETKTVTVSTGTFGLRVKASGIVIGVIWNNMRDYRGADKSLARPGRKQAHVSVRKE